MHIQVWFCDGICVRVGVLVKVAKKSKILKIKGCGAYFMGVWGFRGDYKEWEWLDWSVNIKNLRSLK